MAQKTNLNVSPYFDDFDPEKNYYKLLFNPGRAVQSRELNSIQSLLQNQIESFGSHIFKEGSVVIPGNISYDSQFYAVKLNPTNFGVNISLYIENYIGKKIIGQVSGTSAVVQYVVFPDGNNIEYVTLYVKYIDSDNNFEFNQFEDGEEIYSSDSVIYGSTLINAGESVASLISLDATSIGSAVSISDGIYFIRGTFVNVNKETIILDYYTNTPSYRVGFRVSEQIISAKDDNSLYDNAKGFNNYSAPGADRFKITTFLDKKDLNDSDDTNFIELLRIQDGFVKKIESKTQYNFLKDYIAQRTYDESGDYVVNPFQITINNSLNDRLGNNGIFFAEEKTFENNTPSDDLMCIKVSPGKAYVRGYDIEKTDITILDIEKPRSTSKIESISVPFELGNLIRVNNVSGCPTLRESINLYNLRKTSDNTSPSGALLIGQAKVYNFGLTDSAYTNNSTNWDLYLFDIQTFTVITVNQPLSSDDLKISSYIKGKSSDSSGYSGTAGDGSSVEIILRQTSGSFLRGEEISVDGDFTITRTIVDIKVYTIKDIKSVYQNQFTADTALEFDSLNGFTPLDQVSINPDGTAKSFGKLFSGLNVGSIVKYSNSGISSSLPVFNKVDSISSDGLTITLSSVNDVTNVNIGNLPLNEIKTNILVGNCKIKNNGNGGLYAKLPNSNISSVDLSSSSLIFSAQSGIKTPTVSGDIVKLTVGLSDFSVTDSKFMPFDEERYSIHYSDGTIQKLTSDNFSYNLSSNQVTFFGLIDKQIQKVNATFIKSKIQSIPKTFNRCATRVIGFSKYKTSGDTPDNSNTSIKDGLVYNKFYGLRVQDEEISLNIPDVANLLKIYESLDENDAVLDQITFSSIENVFGNSIIGENIIGSTSNCIAKIVSKSSLNPNNLNIIYLNTNRFFVGEVVKFEESNIETEIVTIIPGKYKDVTDKFTLDDGQKEQYYDYSRIIRNKSQAEPSKRLMVIFDHYQVPTNNNGDVFTVLSYDDKRYTNDIPLIGPDFTRCSDTLDFRPRVSTFNSISASPFDLNSRTFTNEPKLILSPNESCVLGYDFYIPRIDKIYLDKYGNILLEKGISSEKPKLPSRNENVMELATILLPPYLYDPKDAIINITDNRRYTMRDIGKIEDRVENLERVTSLSLLELNTQTLQIQDAQGFNRFRTGFFVDDFKNKNLINIDLSLVEIDSQLNELTPIISKNSLKNQLSPKQNLSDDAIDYSSNYELLDPNVQKTGNIVTLKYEEVEWIKQPLATKVENVNPFHVVEYVGTVKLHPESDVWVRTITLPNRYVTVTSSNNYVRNIETKLSNKKFRAVKKLLRNNSQYRESFYGVNISKNKITTVLKSNSVSYNQSSSTSFNRIEEEYMRSRNTEFSVTGLKPFTRYYQFLDGIGSVDFVPKLIEISSDINLKEYGASKNFIIGEKVIGYLNEKQIISFRVSQPNHKTGPFNSPTLTYNINPYDKNETIPTAYSASSKILNVDTFSLSDEAHGLYSGYIQKGTKLIGSTSGAIAYVKDLRLITDNYGDLIGTFFIRDPYSNPSPEVRISTGNKTYLLTSSSNNESPIPGSKLVSTAQATYVSKGSQELYETTTTTRVTINYSKIRSTIKRRKSCRRDPLAQSFSVAGNIQAPNADESNEDINGAFLSSLDLYFASKDSGNNPVTVEIRTMELGIPTLTVLGNPVTLRPEEILVSSDASLPTRFTFDYPIYLQPGNEYAIVILSPESVEYEVWIAEMGEKTIETSLLPDAESVRYTQQFAIGSLFKSQNGSIWSPSQYQDLKFKLYKCNFTSQNGAVFFNNPPLDASNGYIKKLNSNPITTYPRKLKLKTDLITDTSLVGILTSGRKVTSLYLNTNGGGYGYIEKVGGIVNDIGITTSGFNYKTTAEVQTYSITGDGSGLTLSITASPEGIITDVTTVSGGSGYSIGDVVGIATTSTSTSTGNDALITIKSINNAIDTLYLTNVQGKQFKLENSLTNLQYYDNSGSIISLGSTNVTGSVEIGGIYDGSYMRIQHENHGMYSSNNKVIISNVESDSPISQLSSPLVVSESSKINIGSANTTIFGYFEGIPVNTENPGYVKINNEIIRYESFANGVLSTLTRGIDSTVINDHPMESIVQKYELNGVSLRRINTTHTLNSIDIGIDHYFIKMNRVGTSLDALTLNTNRQVDKDAIGTSGDPKYSPQLSFNSESNVGGNEILSSENIIFTKVRPIFEFLTPGSSTEISAKIRTVSGTSISGNEVSFDDLGYEDVQLNQENNLSSVRLICSKVNESTYLSSLSRNKSFTTILNLSTKDKNISPYVFVDNSFTEFSCARIHSPIKDYVSDPRVNSLVDDPHSLIYVSNTVNLSQPASTLKVIVSAYRNASSDFRVLYNLIRPDSSEIEQSFELFPGYTNLGPDNNQDGFLDIIDPYENNGLPDIFVPSSLINQFLEYEFTAPNIGLFTGYTIKIVASSTNQAYYPRFKDLRSIAIR